MVHLVSPRGEKQQFKDETREELLRVLNWIKPSPSSKNLRQMIAVAERVVTDLTAARKKREEESRSCWRSGSTQQPTSLRKGDARSV